MPSKVTVIDLSKYTFQPMESSWCPCGARVFLLSPRGPEALDPSSPIFFLCAKCGRIAQAGVGEISPPEEGRS